MVNFLMLELLHVLLVPQDGNAQQRMIKLLLLVYVLQANTQALLQHLVKTVEQGLFVLEELKLPAQRALMQVVQLKAHAQSVSLETLALLPPLLLVLRQSTHCQAKLLVLTWLLEIRM